MGAKQASGDTAVGVQGGMYNPQSTGSTAKSAQAAGTVTDPKAQAGYQQAFNTMFQPLLSKGYTQQQIVQYMQTLPGDQSAKLQEQLSTATNKILNPDSTLSKVMQGLALTGSIVGVGLAGVAAAPAIAAGIGATGAVAGGAGLAGTVGTGLGAIGASAIAGAGVGSIDAALQGQNIGKGALLGGLGGGLASAAAPVASGLASSTGLSQPIANSLVKGGISAATSAASGGNAATGFLGGAASGLASGLNTGLGGNALTGIAAGFGANQLAGALSPNQSNGGAVGNINPSAAGSTAQPSGGGSIGNIGNMAVTSVNPSTDSTLASTITGALPGVLQGAAGIYGAQNAAQAQTTADNSAINTQQSTMGNINNIWATQQGLGQGAQTALGASLGTNGQPADPSNFLNMPGYQFAVQQGTQAIQRQAASMGNAYTPNTAEAVGQYVTGTAAQDYNTYIQQLMGAAGLGSTANQNLQTGNLQTGANISQLQQNVGQAQASGVQGAANAVGGLFGVNGAGTSLVGAAGKALTGSTMGGGGVNGSGVAGANPFAGTSLANNPGAYQAYNAANGPTAGDIASNTNGIGNIDTGSFDPNNITSQLNGNSGIGDFDSSLNFSSGDMGLSDFGSSDWEF